MFKIFSFGSGGNLNLNSIKKIGGIMQAFLNSIDIESLVKDYEDTIVAEFHDGSTVDSDSFVELKQDEDMYLLTIELRGIDLRELSIRYDPGIIEVNLNRSEIQKSGFGVLSSNSVIKRVYNKKFTDIEEIDTNQILKNIDNGVLSIRMPKKYVLESGENIIEVESFEDEMWYFICIYINVSISENKILNWKYKIEK